jgi:hypothetical protein
MYQGTGKHTGHAALALLCINKKISFRDRNTTRNYTTAEPHTDNDNAGSFDKIPAGNVNACSAGFFLSFMIIHRSIPPYTWLLLKELARC